MTTYEKILNLGDEFLKLINIGLVPVTVLDWKVYYEAYKLELQRASKTEAACTVAVHYDISRRQMFRIISFMERLN